jgi:hypothetical protein
MKGLSYRDAGVEGKSVDDVLVRRVARAGGHGVDVSTRWPGSPDADPGRLTVMMRA